MPVFRLNRDFGFPDPELASPDGLLAAGGDLSTDRLLHAYCMGIFPWYSEGDPILWWSPDPRAVLFPAEFHLSRRLERSIKQGVFEIRMDTAFDTVIASCSNARGPRRESTWITRDVRAAYSALHKRGFAHSVEAWQDNKLVGGLYGVSIGAFFSGESMFSNVPNASKAALAALVHHVRRLDFHFIDSQVYNAHMGSLGCREIPRADFLQRLDIARQATSIIGPWTFCGWD